MWGVLLKGNGDGELSCPSCGCRPPLRGNDGLIPLGNDETSAVGRARAEGKEGMESPTEGCSGMARAPPPEWTCECCAYTSAGARPCCRNCGAPRPPSNRPPPPSFCADLTASISAFRSSAAAAAGMSPFAGVPLTDGGKETALRAKKADVAVAEATGESAISPGAQGGLRWRAAWRLTATRDTASGGCSGANDCRRRSPCGRRDGGG